MEQRSHQTGTPLSQNGTSLSLGRSGSPLFFMEPADASALPSEATKISSGTLKKLAGNGVCKLFSLSGETMLKDLNTRREVLSGHAQGFSLDRIRRIIGVPKTTVKRIIDLCKASGLPIEQILQLPDAEFENLVEPSRRTRMLSSQTGSLFISITRGRAKRFSCGFVGRSTASARRDRARR